MTLSLGSVDTVTMVIWLCYTPKPGQNSEPWAMYMGLGPYGHLYSLHSIEAQNNSTPFQSKYIMSGYTHKTSHLGCMVRAVALEMASRSGCI
jgi:hypothetical protein